MRLYEFAENPLLVGLVASTSQLKRDIDSGSVKSDWTLSELLRYYRQNDIIVSKNDLYDLIKVPPLNQSIQNIQGDKVIFKGQESEQDIELPPDENKQIVKQMASKAMK
jgi:hypothetical protein